MYIKEDSMNLYLFLTHIIKYQFQSMQKWEEKQKHKVHESIV